MTVIHILRIVHYSFDFKYINNNTSNNNDHCCCSVAKLCPTLCNPKVQLFAGLQHTRLFCPLLSPGICLKSGTLESVIVSNHLTLCFPFSFCLQCFLASVFSNELALHIKWSKNWSFSFSNNPSDEYSGLISFGIDWFDLLAVQRILKNLLQHHSSKASILWHSTFFRDQLSHLNMTTGKTIVLIIWNFITKVISLLFNTLSWFVIAAFPRNKHLLISR